MKPTKHICAYCFLPIYSNQSKICNWDDHHWKDRKYYHRFCFETYQANINQISINNEFNIIL
jgi:hypothetical protein